MLDLVLDNRTTRHAYSRAFLARICEAALPYLKVPKNIRPELGITLIGARAMRTLNRTRRRVDKPTDVLSFPLHMRLIKGYTGLLLGDLFICDDVVRDHAVASGRSARSQMAWTVVHGLLHLAGYDHERSAAGAKRMFATERKILNTLDL